MRAAGSDGCQFAESTNNLQGNMIAHMIPKAHDYPPSSGQAAKHAPSYANPSAGPLLRSKWTSVTANPKADNQGTAVGPSIRETEQPIPVVPAPPPNRSRTPMRLNSVAATTVSVKQAGHAIAPAADGPITDVLCCQSRNTAVTIDEDQPAWIAYCAILIPSLPMGKSGIRYSLG